MLRRERHAPVWVQLVIVTCVGIAWRVLLAGSWAGAWRPIDAGPVHLAFWGFILLIADAIWSGIQAAADVTVEFLVWFSNFIWAQLIVVWNFARGIGSAVVDGFRAAWKFTRLLYDDVLKPAWQHVWKFFDAVRKTLDDVLRPVFRFLRSLRDTLLAIYNHWIRPVLDTIDIARRALRVLGSLGIAWAKKIDHTLADLEAKIEAPFRFVLQKVNEVINFVNRIATADGLFQRVALIRSIERDIRYVQREWHNALSHPLTGEQRTVAATAAEAKPLEKVRRDLHEYADRGEGDDAALINEMADQWRIYFRAA